MFDWITKRKTAPVASGLGPALPLVSTGQGGLLAGTHVASNLGWRLVEALCVGDRVLTFDHGMQEITELHRETMQMSEDILMDPSCPMFVPQDALHNRVPLWVMPDQGILVESDLAEDAQGDPFVVVPACALEGYRGIHRAAAGQHLQLVMPRFGQDQVIYLEAGLLAFSATPFSILETSGPRDGLYRVLQQDAARDLITDMIAEDALWTTDVPAGSAGRGDAQFVSVR